MTQSNIAYILSLEVDYATSDQSEVRDRLYRAGAQIF